MDTMWVGDLQKCIIKSTFQFCLKQSAGGGFEKIPDGRNWWHPPQLLIVLECDESEEWQRAAHSFAHRHFFVGRKEAGGVREDFDEGGFVAVGTADEAGIRRRSIWRRRKQILILPRTTVAGTLWGICCNGFEDFQDFGNSEKPLKMTSNESHAFWPRKPCLE